MAAFCATLRMKAVFPIEGRAATMLNSEGWKPSVSRSRSANPDGTPVTAPPPRAISSIRSIAGHSSSLMR
jgi:hypothetical protein